MRRDKGRDIAVTRKLVGRATGSNVLAASGKVITASLAGQIRSADTGHWIYVSPENGKWVVRRDGALRASGSYSAKSLAVDAAKIKMQGVDTRIIVYNDKGEISQVLKG